MAGLDSRPADAAALRSAGAADVLLTPVWDPISLTAADDAAPSDIAVIGDVPVDGSIHVVGRYADYDEFEAAADGGASWPPVVMCAAPADGDADGAAAVHDGVTSTVRLLQRWLREPRAVNSRLVLATHRGVGIDRTESATRSVPRCPVSFVARRPNIPVASSPSMSRKRDIDWRTLLTTAEPRLAVRADRCTRSG